MAFSTGNHPQMAYLASMKAWQLKGAQLADWNVLYHHVAVGQADLEEYSAGPITRSAIHRIECLLIHRE